jgi:threonine dehydrogenase-like Zn-dependent dehydrogenase
VAGYHADGPRIVNMQSWNWKGIDVINAHERQTPVYVAALSQAFELLRSRPSTVSELHTHHWSLEQASDAFRAAEERPAGFVKSVIHP